MYLLHRMGPFSKKTFLWETFLLFVCSTGDVEARPGPNHMFFFSKTSSVEELSLWIESFSIVVNFCRNCMDHGNGQHVRRNKYLYEEYSSRCKCYCSYVISRYNNFRLNFYASLWIEAFSIVVTFCRNCMDHGNGQHIRRNKYLYEEYSSRCKCYCSYVISRYNNFRLNFYAIVENPICCKTPITDVVLLSASLCLF